MHPCVYYSSLHELKTASLQPLYSLQRNGEDSIGLGESGRCWGEKEHKGQRVHVEGSGGEEQKTYRKVLVRSLGPETVNFYSA